MADKREDHPTEARRPLPPGPKKKAERGLEALPAPAEAADTPLDSPRSFPLLPHNAPLRGGGIAIYQKKAAPPKRSPRPCRSGSLRAPA